MRVGIFSRDYLQELQIARRVEEVRPEETLLESLRTVLRDAVERDAGGVRRNNGVALRKLLYPHHQVLLGLQLLDNRFEDPIGVLYALQVVFEVAGAHPLYYALAHEGGRPGVLHPLETRVD